MATTIDQRVVPGDVSSPRAKLVYLYLASEGGATAADVAGTLSMDKMTVFAILRSLCGDELIRKDDAEYACL